MKLSVIILNYNVRYFLEQCIISVERAIEGIAAEIIVVDNDSNDDSCAMVANHFPHIKLIANKENVGFSKANNQAVAIAKGEYVCILNPDTVVGEDTLLGVIGYAETLPNLGALGINLMDGTGNFLPESKRNLPTPSRSLLKMIGKTKGRNGYYAEHIDETEEGEVDVLVGAFMLMKRTVYLEVGGFDEDYFMYGEDIDLSYKLQKAGYNNAYFGSLTMLHYKGESTQKDAAYLDRFYGAMRIFYSKHFRSNFLINNLVGLAVGLAKIFRKRKEKNRKPISPRIKEVLIFSENCNLIDQLSDKFNVPVKAASIKELENKLFANTMCVFDADCITYKEIFSVMKDGKNRQNSFRMKPPGCNFVIGSDQSDDKGGVVLL